jgi:hypothetical protein
VYIFVAGCPAMCVLCRERELKVELVTGGPAVQCQVAFRELPCQNTEIRPNFLFFYIILLCHAGRAEALRHLNEERMKTKSSIRLSSNTRSINVFFLRKKKEYTTTKIVSRVSDMALSPILHLSS